MLKQFKVVSQFSVQYAIDKQKAIERKEYILEWGKKPGWIYFMEPIEDIYYKKIYFEVKIKCYAFKVLNGHIILLVQYNYDDDRVFDEIYLEKISRAYSNFGVAVFEILLPDYEIFKYCDFNKVKNIVPIRSQNVIKNLNLKYKTEYEFF